MKTDERLIRTLKACKRVAQNNPGTLTEQLANDLIHDIEIELEMRAQDKWEANADHDCRRER